MPQAEQVVVPEENVRVHRRRAGGQAGGRLLQVRERLQQVMQRSIYDAVDSTSPCKIGSCQGANVPEVSVIIDYSFKI